jgi:predicted ATPase
MADPKANLRKKFEPNDRYANFGPAITQIMIHGFRCHRNTVIDVYNPITAFCGLNGTGKSTVLQVLAVARRAISTDERTFYLRDFFRQGGLDLTPILPDASVIFKFWRNDGSTQQLTISRSPNRQQWSGYKRRPSGNVFFGSVGLYVPKIEQKDMIARHYEKLIVTDSQDAGPRLRDWSGRILSQGYSKIAHMKVQYGIRANEVLAVTRDGFSYSEMHMGFGEGRSQFLVNELERMPDKSLVLIEEPETSLHPAAQFEFGQYLIDVSLHKGHQVFLTTHSEALLRALSAESRIYFYRSSNEVKQISGLSSSQAQSLMTGGHDKSLCVLVEDGIAQAILSEIVRRVDQAYLPSLNIVVGGDKDTIARTVRSLASSGLRVVAVRDGDMPDLPKENVFKLPGKSAPELEVLSATKVHEFVGHQYGVEIDNFFASLGTVDHHELFGKLAAVCCVDMHTLVTECARSYVGQLEEFEMVKLVDLMKAAEK